MPVSTRSKVIFNQVEHDPNQDQRTRLRKDQEECQMANQMRNPHHGLKEKMKALTLLYEQQKQVSNAIKNPALKHEEPRFSTHPSIDLLKSGRRDEKEAKETKELSHTSHVMRENLLPSSTVTRNFVMPKPIGVEEAKENVAVGGGSDQIVGFSCPRKTNVSSTVARKLSMGSSAMPYSEPPRGSKKVNEQELETIMEKQGNDGGGNGSRILVFVRLRPMGKKEREAGSRCCVRIVNKRDVYLTEFATENDYLRLKRLRGRHFTFDASFPDSTTQQEVYFTT